MLTTPNGQSAGNGKRADRLGLTQMLLLKVTAHCLHVIHLTLLFLEAVLDTAHQMQGVVSQPTTQLTAAFTLIDK